MTNNFIKYELTHDVLADMTDDQHPTILRGMVNDRWELEDNGTHMGYILEGTAILIDNKTNVNIELQTGMYFQLPNDGSVNINGRGIVITRINYNGLFKVGGPIEDKGRMKYIDGCTDTLLLDPVLLGDPCLNGLYFIPNILQTQHTHPSMRVGIVVQGRGECIVPKTGVMTEEDSKYMQGIDAKDRDQTEKFNELFDRIELKVGTTFVIPTDSWHSFRTFADKEGKETTMTVIAYHPDSDFGPTHEDHPMINRTWVDGVSANEIKDIQTKELT
jgi:hypothetical protein